METVRSRFLKVMRGEMPEDRLPMMEWAAWWDKTITRWHGEGLSPDLNSWDIKRSLGLDVDYQHWFPNMLPGGPNPPQYHGDGWIESMDDYETLLPFLYPDPVPFDRDAVRGWASEQRAGDVIIWISWCGFFWWPRSLMGIERHLFGFFDQPELMHRINQDQLAYQKRCLEAFTEICTPDFMTFGEDMSYNHGPMISKPLYDEFMAPYYKQIVPLLKEAGVTAIIDSDGDVEPLIPWFLEVGLEGILPLERMAGVDVNRIRENYPEWKMMGGYDKMVMHLGEERMRQEFERLMPAMRSGLFVPSVDHQTPPGVSFEDYHIYLRLLKEYSALAVS